MSIDPCLQPPCLQPPFLREATLRTRKWLAHKKLLRAQEDTSRTRRHFASRGFLSYRNDILYRGPLSPDGCTVPPMSSLPSPRGAANNARGPVVTGAFPSGHVTAGGGLLCWQLLMITENYGTPPSEAGRFYVVLVRPRGPTLPRSCCSLHFFLSQLSAYCASYRCADIFRRKKERSDEGEHPPTDRCDR